MLGSAGLKVRTNGMRSGLLTELEVRRARAELRVVDSARSIELLIVEGGKPLESRCCLSCSILRSSVSFEEQILTRRKARLYGILFLVWIG